MHIYENHLGGFYSSDELYDFEFLYCEQCGDSDMYVGEVKTKKELKELLNKEYKKIYLKAYINKVANELFDERG